MGKLVIWAHLLSVCEVTEVSVVILRLHGDGCLLLSFPPLLPPSLFPCLRLLGCLQLRALGSDVLQQAGAATTTQLHVVSVHGGAVGVPAGGCRSRVGGARCETTYFRHPLRRRSWLTLQNAPGPTREPRTV